MNHSNNNFLDKSVIRLFVYGTLRKGQKFHFYMKGAEYKGMYYTEGQLMKAENGSVYIDKSQRNVATIGEVYYVSYYCLERINFLEALSGQFPKGYDLDVISIWPFEGKGKYDFDPSKAINAFYYRRKNGPTKILDGDYSSDFEPIEELRLILETLKEADSEMILEIMRKKLSNFEYIY